MKKLFIILAAGMMLFLTACGNKFTAEQAEAAVLQGERDRLPLLIQSLPFVDDITIDSIHMTITEEPMQGYMYTTWKKNNNEQSIIVQVDSVRQDATRKGYIQWQSSWDNAARSYMLKSLNF
jgi:hypothetical protein